MSVVKREWKLWSLFFFTYFCPIDNKLTLKQVCPEVVLKEGQIVFGLFPVKAVFYLSFDIIWWLFYD